MLNAIRKQIRNATSILVRFQLIAAELDENHEEDALTQQVFRPSKAGGAKFNSECRTDHREGRLNMYDSNTVPVVDRVAKVFVSLAGLI